MSREDVQRAVRQRDRFKCQYPRCEKRGENYAHIVSEADGGAYDLDNIIYLCYEHHTQWQETDKAKPLAKEALQESSRRLRDKPKAESIISSAFDWPAGAELAIALGGGMRFVNQHRVLESSDPEQPYLAIQKDEFGFLLINARFDNVDGDTFMRIDDNIMTIDTASAWDLVITRRRFSVEDSGRQINLRIDQRDDLALQITGRLFLNGSQFTITKDRVVDEQNNNTFENCAWFNSGHGAFLQAGVFRL